MKFIDLLGKELNVGDIVVNATKCTDSAHLRRSILKRKYEDHSYTSHYGFDVKSIIVSRGGWVSCGNTSIGDYHNKKTEVVKLDVIRLGKLEEAFLPEEIELIKKHNVKVDYE